VNAFGKKTKTTGPFFTKRLKLIDCPSVSGIEKSGAKTPTSRALPNIITPKRDKSILNLLGTLYAIEGARKARKP